jgi:site-specific recombinase XerD
MYATEVRMEFKRITEKAGLGRDRTPHELRHTFVSLLPGSGPSTRTAAVALGPLFESRGKIDGGQS